MNASLAAREEPPQLGVVRLALGIDRRRAIGHGQRLTTPAAHLEHTKQLQGTVK